MDVSDPHPPAPSAKPFSQLVDGFRIPGKFSADCFRSAIRYEPRPGDIFVATYPKCGTNWMQHMLRLIFRQGEPIASQLKVFSSAPFLELTGAEGADKMPRPGAFSTHLPYHLAPKSDQAKYIHVARNPKDCCVSYFHHMRNVPGHAFNGTFDQFFEIFVSGNTDFGEYFDHLLGWYAHRNDPNVLFLTYEEMKENQKEAVLKIASFIDDELYAEPLRNDPEKLENVIRYSSLKHMKEVVNKGMSEMFQMSKEEVSKSELPSALKKILSSGSLSSSEAPKVSFVRKGIVGDWKNYFTEEQSKRLEEKFAERTKGTDLADIWGKYM